LWFSTNSWNEEAAKQIGDGYWYLIFHISKTLEEFVSKDGGSPMAIDCFKETVSTKSMTYAYKPTNLFLFRVGTPNQQ
jgi:hypothetical protein